MDAFKIQDEIDKAANLQDPISIPLMEFLIEADPEFIPMYLNKIERECMFEGERHEASLIANLLSILKVIRSFSVFYEKIKEETIKQIIDLNPPISLYQKNPEFIPLFAQYDSEFLPKYLKKINQEGKLEGKKKREEL